MRLRLSISFANAERSKVHVYGRLLKDRTEFIEQTPKDVLRVGHYCVDDFRIAVCGSKYDFIVVLYGWIPNLDYAQGLDLMRNSKGFVTTNNRTTETSTPNAFAIGEVA
jgi:thioredoxin reductase (NADPH)